MKRVRQQSKRKGLQRELEFPRHGGARPGAGRKPKGAVAGPSHAARPPTSARHPSLVTQRLCAGLRSLRQRAEFEVVRGAIAEAATRAGFRIVHFSVQTNHVHYVCEARDTRSLTSGMRSLGVMIARRLNALWKRTGPVFAERYHARALATPNEVRQALAYVLNNARKHGIQGDGVDPFRRGRGSMDGVLARKRRAPASATRATMYGTWRRRRLPRPGSCASAGVGAGSSTRVRFPEVGPPGAREPGRPRASPTRFSGVRPRRR
jgi:REP element-mobilizing transposase RayT